MRRNEQRALLASIVVLVASSLLIASGPRWATCTASVLALLAVVPLVGSRRVLRAKAPLLILLGIALLATAAQLVPLPLSLVQVLSPERHAMEVANAKAYGGSIPALVSLTHDVSGSLVELCKLVGYVAFAYVCLRLSRSDRARDWLRTTVVAVGAIIAVTALGHRLVGAEALYGLYEPESEHFRLLSPFLNPNHLAGYLAFIVPLSLGLAIKKRSLLFAMVAAVCAGTALLSQSRGGVLSLFVGLAVSGSIYFVTSRSQQAWTRQALLQAVALLASLSLLVGALFLSTDVGRKVASLDMASEFESGKLLAWRYVPDLLDGSHLTGVGRGAFEASFPRVQPPSGVTYSHLENEYLQALVDWGLPVFLLLLLAALAWGRDALRRTMEGPMRAACWGALSAVAVHASYDFVLTLPGMVLPAIAIAATIAPASLEVARKKGRRLAREGVRIGLIAAGISVCAVAASPVGATVEEALAARQEFSDSQVRAGSVLASTREISRLHPADYRLAVEASMALWRLQDSRAFDTLGRALELRPGHWAVHLLAARMLAGSQQRRQALVEYRIALTLPSNRNLIAASLVKEFPAADEIVAGSPIEPAAASRTITALMRLERYDAASILAGKLVAAGNAPLPIYQQLVRSLAREGDAKGALLAARRADKHHQSPESLELLVFGLIEANLKLEAIELLAARFSLSPHPDETELELLALLAELQLDLGRLSEAEASGQALLDFAHRRGRFAARAHEILAGVEEYRGNGNLAQWHRRKAASLK